MSSRAGPNVLIRATDLGKCYELYANPRDRLKQLIFGHDDRRYFQEVWALRDVSFEIKRGEVVGVIGRNGSGKSTLLQLICGVLRPTTGSVEVKGRISALLELGAGFNPDFTGRENVFLNGALLGLSHAELSKRLPEIESFAEIGKFLDAPVRTYSSGMVVRLAFAVQACVDPDVMIVDEALAVGDIFFRRKCYRRLEDLRRQGCTILLVTHAMMDVEQFCERAILLDGGRTTFQGNAVEGVKRYYLQQQNPAASERLATERLRGQVDETGPLTDGAADDWPVRDSQFRLQTSAQVATAAATCVRVALTDIAGTPTTLFEQGQTAVFWYEFEVREDLPVPLGGLTIHNDRGVIVHGKGSLEHDSTAPDHVAAGSVLRFTQSVQLDIALGEYTFEVGLASMAAALFEARNSMSIEELYSSVVRLCHVPNLGVLRVGTRTKFHGVQLLHHGVANLPGNCHIEVVRRDRIGPAAQ
jgi:lipopolysaccharide transport system ATP-binding protein